MEDNQEYPRILSVVVLREEFDEWAVLYNPDTADAVGINPVGVAIWKLMDGKHSIKDIAADVQKQFEEVPESLLDDVTKFVRGLLLRKFISVESAAS